MILSFAGVLYGSAFLFLFLQLIMLPLKLHFHAFLLCLYIHTSFSAKRKKPQVFYVRHNHIPLPVLLSLAPQQPSDLHKERMRSYILPTDSLSLENVDIMLPIDESHSFWANYVSSHLMQRLVLSDRLHGLRTIQFCCVNGSKLISLLCVVAGTITRMAVAEHVADITFHILHDCTEST